MYFIVAMVKFSGFEGLSVTSLLKLLLRATALCPRAYFMCNQLLTVIIIRSIPCEFFFPFIGRQPTKRPANNFMVCSCAMSSNYAWLVWLQIIFCSCENETTLFSFLRSLLRENGSFPNIFIVIYQKTNSVTL